MITPEPPAGSEHYREGWRHGYEQAAIDRERSTDAVRLVPESEVQVCRTDREKGEKIADLMREVAELRAGAVPDTGQAREPIQRGRWNEERDALAGKLLDHLLDYEAALGRLPVDDVDGAMAVRLANVVLSAGWQPSGGTVPAREPGEAIALIDSILPQAHIAVPYADDELDDQVEIAPLEDYSTWRQVFPDTGQAREPDDLTEALNWLRSNWATNSRDWALDRREAAWYGVLVGWDCEEDHDHDDICGGTSGMDFVARRHVWAPAFVEALRRRRAAVAAAQSTDTVQTPDAAAVVEAAKRLERHWYADCRTAFAHTPEGDLITAVRALLGTDTTPDRLAWIGTAAETAAAARQARYQETACARRPAATSGDPAQPDLAYARSEVSKWLADNDPYCILPTRTEHIPALLARLDELEGTR